MDNIDLTGQVAVVTGSGYRAGRSIAQVLTSAGATVRLIVKTEDERSILDDLIDDTEGRFDVIVANTANRMAVNRAIQNLKAQAAFITLVVNIVDFTVNAVPLWQVDPGEWSASLETSLRNSLLWTKAAIAEMSRGGRIINIADPSLFVHLTSSFETEAQSRGIKIFSIDPLSEFMRESVLLLASGRAAQVRS